jgi:hypothetical protein
MDIEHIEMSPYQSFQKFLSVTAYLFRDSHHGFSAELVKSLMDTKKMKEHRPSSFLCIISVILWNSATDAAVEKMSSST